MADDLYHPDDDAKASSLANALAHIRAQQAPINAPQITPPALPLQAAPQARQTPESSVGNVEQSIATKAMLRGSV